MNAHKASLINAIILIVGSLISYYYAGMVHPTTFVPLGIGVILLLLNNGVKNKNKVIAHVAVVLTLICLVGLLVPVLGPNQKAKEPLALTIMLIMIASTIFAKVFFIKNFRDVRKERERMEQLNN